MDAIDRLADIFKALSDPTRLKLIRLLSDGKPLCVNALTRRLGITQSAVSQHLRVLKQAGLVTGVRCGSFVHYSLNQDQLEAHNRRLAKTFGNGFVKGADGS